MMIPSTINSFKSLTIFIIITTHIFLLQNNFITFVIAQELHPPKLGYSVKERVALFALKSSLNNPFLNRAWIGPHCAANDSKWYGIRCDTNGFVTEIALESMGLKGTISVNAFTSFTELSVLSFNNNSIGGTLIDFAFNRNLKRVDLSENVFSGPIPVSLSGLSGLVSVLLQENSFSGSIPEFDSPSMREFNVSNNNLTGPIPRNGVFQSFGMESYKGNPGLCGPPSTTVCVADSPQPQTGSKSASLFGSIKRYLLVLDFVLLLVVILLFIWYFKKAKKLKKKKILMMRDYQENRKEEKRDHPERSQADDQSHVNQDHDQKMSNIIEIQKENDHKRRSSSSSAIVISNNKDTEIGINKLIFFDDSNSNFEMSDLLKASAEWLGQYYGTFGNCYKAMMEGKEAVVVKRLRNLRPLSDEEFEKQLRIIAEQRHPNLLPILAYCNGKDDKLLVYKYVERGNLFDRIHGKRGAKGAGPSTRTPFLWRSRLTVATGVARALSHLHLNMPPTILVPHGNLKPTNVLLGPDDTPLVSDFSLSSLVSVPVAVQRTASYRSPEFNLTPSASAKRVSPKSDVWSYGCLLLELLTGKVSTHTAPPGSRGSDLAGWVHKAVREEWTAEIFDKEIFSSRRSAVPGALRLLEVAMRCVERSPEKRPEMVAVAKMVEDIYNSGGEQCSEDENSSFDRSWTDESMSSGAVGSGTVSGDFDRVK